MGSATRKTIPLFTTEPHAEHDVNLLEDAPKPDDRIYEISDRYEKGATIRVLGSELASLCQWWAAEKGRVGHCHDEEEETT